MSNMMTTANGGGQAIMRQEFGAQQIERRHETAQTAMAAHARAQVEAAFIVARANPRSWEDVRVRLLEECKRPGFANSAWFKKPQGGKYIEGLSVRFAEAALRTAGNLRRGSMTTYDDDYKRHLTIYVVDLETNAWTEAPVTVEKTVERRDNRGRLVLAERTNTAGEKVYIVASTEDELRMKEGALISKVSRNLILQMVPGDIQDDCRQQVQETRKNADAKDPNAARKALVDAFASMNVLPSELAKFLGHDVATCTPAEIDELRGVYATLRDGEMSWTEILAEKTGEGVATPSTASATTEAQPATRGARAAQRVRKQTPAQQPGDPPFGDASQEQVTLSTGVPATVQTEASTQSTTSPPAVSREQQALLESWPPGSGLHVTVQKPDGTPYDSYTTGRPYIHGGLAVIVVQGIRDAVPLSSVHLKGGPQ